MMTLNFAFSDCEPDRMPQAFEYIRDMAVRWFRYETRAGRVPEDDQFAFIWALEHVGDWHHVHWLVHLPRGTEHRFLDRIRKWSLRAAGIVRDGYLDIRPFDRNGPNYVSKGTDPSHFQGHPRWRTPAGGQGYFHHKRCGVSANLSGLVQV